MRDAFRLLFWLWFLGSMGVLVVRTTNKRSGATAPTVNGKLSLLDSLLGKVPEGTAARPAADRSAALAAPPTTPSGAAPAPTRATAVPFVPAAPAPAPPAGTGDADAVETGEAGEAGGRHGLFASQPAPSAPPPGTPAGTVADALQGITWPCGLTPLIDLANQHLAEREVAFWTTEAPAGEVGGRLGDALERCGYALRSRSDTTVEARRDDAVLEVHLHPEAGAAERHGVALYPTLPPRAVVAVITRTG